MAHESVSHAGARAQTPSKTPPVTSIGFSTDGTTVLYQQNGYLHDIPALDGWSFLKENYPNCPLMTAAFRMGMAYQQATGGVDHE